MERDLLLVMSDQHGQAYTQMENPAVSTPNLMRIAERGISFRHCYCNAPLCVPSRMSFLGGKLPSELQIFNNDTTLPVDMPTIAHGLGAKGYHTVLIGRMHFKGDEQKHGFDERLAGDITSQYWGTGGKQRTDFGAYRETTNRNHCLDVIGGGYSPVMAYDEMVFQTAMEYLEQKHDKPLFLVVGFYAPHFPFACDPVLYEKYKKRFPVCRDSGPECAEFYENYRMECSPEKARNAKAAYCGLVETVDTYTGRLYDRFIQGRENYAFAYTSDHGEQLGRRGLFGKQALYEDAVRVPLVIEGTGICHRECREQVSLLDVSKTLLRLGGVEGAWHDGTAIDLWGSQDQTERKRPPAVIQQILLYRHSFVPAEAVVSMPFKAVRYGGGEIRVYHLEDDPDESVDVASQYPEFVREAWACMMSKAQLDLCIEHEWKQKKQHEQLKAWGLKKRPKEWATMSAPLKARQKPVE